MKKAIFSSVSEAIYQTYPEARRFKGVSKGTVRFTTVENILSIQKGGAPKQNLYLYQALAEVFGQFGLPETELEKWRYKAAEEKPGFTNYEEGVVYLPYAMVYNLLLPNSRIEASKELGNTLIEEAIKTYGYRVGSKVFEHVPWSFFWGFMMDHDLDDSYGFWEKRLKNKKDRMRFREARKGISYLFSQKGIEQEEVQFWAAGVKILAVRKGQSLISAEYILGEDFDDGTVQSLAEPAKKRFLELLGKKLNIKMEVEDGSGKTEKQKRAEVVHGVMGLKGKKLFSAYTHSEFPLAYMRSNTPELNPFRYPEVFIEP